MRLNAFPFTAVAAGASRGKHEHGAGAAPSRASGGQEGPSDARRFALGTRSLADLIAPGAVEVGRDHLRLDRQFARTLVVTGYPRTVGPGWLAPLVELDAPLEISLHLHPVDSAEMVRSLSHRLAQLHSSRLLAARGGRLADPEREVACDDLERLRDALERGDERAFSVGLALLLRAPSREALDDLTRRVETTLAGMLLHSRVALLEQDTGFVTCLPQGRDRLGVYRNLDTSSVAAAFPFCAADLSSERGVLYGVAGRTSSPVILDPFGPELDNANHVVFATSGAGKSYFTKLLALRSLQQGVDVLIIDPEDEYRALCAAVGGQHVRLGAGSAQQINPFDLPLPLPASASAARERGVGPAASASPPLGGRERGRPAAPGRPDADADEAASDPLAEQVAALIGLLEIALAGPDRALDVYERSVLDAAVYRTYAAAGITADPATHAAPAPVMRDLLAALERDAGDVAAGLASRLRRYVEGSLRGLFTGPTSVSLDRPLTVFDVQRLEPELRPLAIHVIAAFVWGRVRSARRPRLLVVDEAWSLLQYREGGAFLAGLARRARKYFLGLVTISQDVQDFLGSEHGPTVLGNAAVKVLLKQDHSTVEPVVDALHLSAEERRYLLAASKGEGLLCARGARVALAIEASPAEHRLATTAPWELAGQSGDDRHDVHDAGSGPVASRPAVSVAVGAPPGVPIPNAPAGASVQPSARADTGAGAGVAARTAQATLPLDGAAPRRGR